MRVRVGRHESVGLLHIRIRRAYAWGPSVVMAHCPECDAEIEASDTFCGACRYDLRQPQNAPTAAPPHIAPSRRWLRFVARGLIVTLVVVATGWFVVEQMGQDTTLSDPADPFSGVSDIPQPAPPPAPEPVPAPATGRLEAPTIFVKQLDVPADQLWTDSEWDLAAGDEITFRAEGLVHACASGNCADPRYQQWVGAEGLFSLPRLQANGLPDMALVMRVADWAPAYVGPQITLQINVPGRLYLGVNDFPASQADNAGRFAVSLTLSRKSAQGRW